MTTRATGVITDGQGHFTIEEFDVADPGPGEVQVTMAASGVCHTDHDLAGLKIPNMVLGHEGAGVVAAVGEGVTKVAAGDRVLLTWAIACGSCFQCTIGNQVLCETLGMSPKGSAKWGSSSREGTALYRAFNIGTLSTTTLVRQEAVVKLGVEIPMTSACILGCGVMTGYGSVVNAAHVKPGSTVAVLGTGGVGLNVIQGARIAGAAMIVGVDVNDQRLEMAKQFGATHVVKASRDDTGLLHAAKEVAALTGNGGADYSFECTAVPELGAAPLAMVHNGGVAIQVSGIEQDITIDMRLFEWDKTYLNPLYGKCRPSIDFPQLLALYAKGDLLLDELVTRTYPLKSVEDAFDDLLAGRNAKGVIDFSLT